MRRQRVEEIMEATAQATQRTITLASLDQVHGLRPDVHVFNELLVQYKLTPRSRHIEQVVPDNMVVQYDGNLEVETSYDIELQPARPLLMLEYVSKSNKRKDYEHNDDRYEQQLKVPYYLLFYPDNVDLTLFQLRRRRYVSVPFNDQGRQAIPELELEVAVLEGWVRYWFRGGLLPLPEDWQREMTDIRQALQAERQRAAQEAERAEEFRQRAAEADRRAEEEAQRAADLERQVQELRAELGRAQKRPRNGK